MDLDKVALKIIALLHDPPFKPLVFIMKPNERKELAERLKTYDFKELLKQLGKEESAIEFHERIALYIISGLLTNIEEYKPKLAKMIRDHFRTYYSIACKCDIAASSIDRTILNMLYVNVVDRVLFKHPIELSEHDLTRYCRELIRTPENKSRVNNLAKAIDYFIEFISDAINAADDGFEHHVLWRLLIPCYVKSLEIAYSDLKPEVIKLLTLTPADTRAPYTTIFDHLYATSCLATVGNDDIGLVYWEVEGKQDFISKARIPRDLWSGSYLISLMTLYVNMRLAEELGPESIVRPVLMNLPLYDIYVYSHVKIDKLSKINLARSKTLDFKLHDILTPVIPGATLLVVPASEIQNYVSKILSLYREAWNAILNSYLKEIRNVLSSARRTLDEKFPELKDYVSIVEDLDKIFGEAYDKVPFNVSVVYVKIPWDMNKRSMLLEELSRRNLVDHDLRRKFNDMINVLRKIGLYRLRSECVYEWPLFVDALHNLHYTQSLSKAEHFIESVDVRKRDELCNVCWTRKSIITVNEKAIYMKEDDEERNKLLEQLERYLGDSGLIRLGIKSNDRLCIYCLIRRCLWDIRKDTVLPRLLADMLAPKDRTLKTWIVEILNNIVNEYIDSSFTSYVKKYIREHIEEYGVAYPSTENIASSSFIYTLLSLIRGLDEEDIDVLIKGFEDLIGFLDNVARNRLSPILGPSKGYTPKSIYTWNLVRSILERMSNDVLRSKVAVLLSCLDYVGWLYKEHYIRYNVKLDHLNVALENVKRYVENRILTMDINDFSSFIQRSTDEHVAYGSMVRGISDYLALIRGDGDNVGDMLAMRGTFSRKIMDIIPRRILNMLTVTFKSTVDKISIDNIMKIALLPGLSYTFMVSRALSLNALDVIDELISKLHAVVIYSGGDDVLLLAPCELALRTTLISRSIYSRSLIEVSDKIANVSYYVPGLGSKATQSYAIRFIDAFSPLRWEVNNTFIDLEHAKKVSCMYGAKNTICIVYGVPNGSHRAYVSLDPLGVERTIRVIEDLGLAASIGSNEYGMVVRNGSLDIVKGFSSRALYIKDSLLEDYVIEEFKVKAERHGFNLKTYPELEPLSRIILDTPEGKDKTCLLDEILKASYNLSRAFRESKPVVIGDTL